MEIRRIQEQQEKIEEEYKGLRESLSVQLRDKEERVQTLSKDLMFMHQAHQQERLNMAE
jgi:hypothetical protein